MVKRMWSRTNLTGTNVTGTRGAHDGVNMITTETAISGRLYYSKYICTARKYVSTYYRMDHRPAAFSWLGYIWFQRRSRGDQQGSLCLHFVLPYGPPSKFVASAYTS